MSVKYALRIMWEKKCIAAVRMHLISVVITFFLASACVAGDQDSTDAKASAFINALNTDNIQKMRSLADVPFSIRNQEWESAQDGYGFVLGNKKDEILENNDQLQHALKSISETVEVEGIKPIVVKSPGGPSIKKELTGIENIWNALDQYVFLRGMGDVEHIVIVGVDPANKKVKALYIN